MDVADFDPEGQVRLRKTSGVGKAAVAANPHRASRCCTNGPKPSRCIRSSCSTTTHLPRATTVEDVEALLAWNIEPDKLRQIQL